MRRLWLDGILQKEVPSSYETVEREASQKNVLSEDSIYTTQWNHPSKAIGLTQCLLSHLHLVYVQP